MIAWSLAIALAAQTSVPAASPKPGDWVRVTTTEPVRTYEGRVKELSDESLSIAGSDPGEVPLWGTEAPTQAAAGAVVPLTSIARVDLRIQESRKARGALLGAGAGIVAGLAAGVAGSSGSGTIVAIDPASFAVAGAVLGVVIGAIVAPGAKWRQGIPLERVRVGVGPVRRGARFSMTVTF